MIRQVATSEGRPEPVARSLLVSVIAALALLGVTLVRAAPVERRIPTLIGPVADLEPCVRTGSLDSLGALDRFVARVRGPGSFAGGDVGASALLPDGRRVFVFGDTLRGPDFAGQQFVHNSMLVFSDGCGQVVMPRDRGAVVPDRADGVGYWPMSIVATRSKGREVIGMGLQRVRATGTGVFGFEVLGPAFARFDVAPGEAPQLVSVRDLGPDRVDTTAPMWGAAAVLDDGWVYVYGTVSGRLASAFRASRCGWLGCVRRRSKMSRRGATGTGARGAGGPPTPSS